jgi:O-antigen/teichoic acid export membrane protein
MRLPTGVDPITRGWAVVTSAGVARLGLGFVASLLVARALGPADYGIYAVLAATVAIVGGLAEGGLTEAAVLRISRVVSTRSDVDAVQGTAAARARAFFWLRIGLASFVVVIGCALSAILARDVLRVDDALLRWALLGIVATAASGAVSAMLQSMGAFARMSSLTVVNTALTAALALLLTLAARLDLLTALIVLGIGTSLATFALGVSLLPKGWSLALPSRAALKAEATQLIRTGRWLWIASLFAMLAANLEVLLLNGAVDLATVGAYALALNLASKADVVNTSLYTVLLTGVSTLHDRGGVRGYLKRSVLRSAAIVVALLLLVPLAGPLIGLFYGPDFAQAVPLFQLLLGVMAFDVLLTPLLLLPLAYREARLLAAGDATRAGVLFVVALAAIPTFGASGAILARFASHLAGAVLILSALWLGRTTLQVEHEEAAGVAH